MRIKLTLQTFISIAIITLTVGFFVAHNNVLAQDANTVLLLHMDGTNGSTIFTDSSDSAHTVTSNGNAQMSTTQSKYSGASANFDGSGDYLSIPDSDDWDFGSGDFTVDFWINSSSFTNNDSPIAQVQDGSNVWYLFFTNSGADLRFYSTGDIVDFSGAHGMSTGTWYHIAIIRGWNGNTNDWAITVNGSSVATTTDASTMPAISGSLFIGDDTGNGNGPVDGYIDEIRISKGVARWTSNFTPPTAPYGGSGGGGTPDPDTKLLLHMDGTDGSTSFTDSSGTAYTVTANGDAKISTTQSMFSDASGSFDGSGDYLSIPDSADWNFGSGDFTIDTWVRFDAITGSQAVFVSHSSQGDNWWRFLINVGPVLLFNQYEGGAITINAQVSWAPAIDTWYHVTVTRTGGDTYRFFVDGVQLGTDQTDSTAIADFTGSLEVGRRPTDQGVNGNMDEFRISKGIARWTTNFTPPTAPYGDSGGGIQPPTGGGDGNSLDAADGDPIDAVYVDNDGNVGIGTTNPGLYKLAVNGTIKTKEVVVELTGWSDFVFNKHYNLMPLGQLEKYIENNKHLPQIPSADEAVGKGIGVGSMQAKLLQKIEELTLYMIKMEKKTNKFEQENEKLKKEMGYLKGMMNQ